MAAKDFCLDDENEGSDSEADDSGWKDDDAKMLETTFNL